MMVDTDKTCFHCEELLLTEHEYDMGYHVDCFPRNDVPTLDEVPPEPLNLPSYVFVDELDPDGDEAFNKILRRRNK